MASIAAPPTRSTEVHNHHHSSGVHSSSHSSSKYSLGGGVAAEEYTGGALDKGRRRTAQVASLDSDGLYTQVGQYVEIATHHVYHTPVKIEAARKLQNLFRSWRDWSTFQYLKQAIVKAEACLSIPLIRKVSPSDASLLVDGYKAKIRFRFEGTHFPPAIVYKIYTGGIPVQYMSAAVAIPDGSQACRDAAKHMGPLQSARVEESFRAHGASLQYRQAQLLDRQSYMRLLSDLDRRKAGYGGRGNTWRYLADVGSDMSYFEQLSSLAVTPLPSESGSRHRAFSSALRHATAASPHTVATLSAVQPGFSAAVGASLVVGSQAHAVRAAHASGSTKGHRTEPERHLPGASPKLPGSAQPAWMLPDTGPAVLDRSPRPESPRIALRASSGHKPRSQRAHDGVTTQARVGAVTSIASTAHTRPLRPVPAGYVVHRASEQRVWRRDPVHSSGKAAKAAGRRRRAKLKPQCGPRSSRHRSVSGSINNSGNSSSSSSRPTKGEQAVRWQSSMWMQSKQQQRRASVGGGDPKQAQQRSPRPVRRASHSLARQAPLRLNSQPKRVRSARERRRQQQQQQQHVQQQQQYQLAVARATAYGGGIGSAAAPAGGGSGGVGGGVPVISSPRVPETWQPRTVQVDGTSPVHWASSPQPSPPRGRRGHGGTSSIGAGGGVATAAGEHHSIVIPTVPFAPTSSSWWANSHAGVGPHESTGGGVAHGGHSLLRVSLENSVEQQGLHSPQRSTHMHEMARARHPALLVTAGLNGSMDSLHAHATPRHGETSPMHSVGHASGVVSGGGPGARLSLLVPGGGGGSGDSSGDGVGSPGRSAAPVHTQTMQLPQAHVVAAVDRKTAHVAGTVAVPSPGSEPRAPHEALAPPQPALPASAWVQAAGARASSARHQRSSTTSGAYAGRTPSRHHVVTPAGNIVFRQYGIDEPQASAGSRRAGAPRTGERRAITAVGTESSAVPARQPARQPARPRTTARPWRPQRYHGAPPGVAGSGTHSSMATRASGNPGAVSGSHSGSSTSVGGGGSSLSAAAGANAARVAHGGRSDGVGGVLGSPEPSDWATAAEGVNDAFLDVPRRVMETPEQMTGWDALPVAVDPSRSGAIRHAGTSRASRPQPHTPVGEAQAPVVQPVRAPGSAQDSVATATEH